MKGRTRGHGSTQFKIDAIERRPDAMQCRNKQVRNKQIKNRKNRSRLKLTPAPALQWMDQDGKTTTNFLAKAKTVFSNTPLCRPLKLAFS
jgi:hypothetical protein